MAEYESKIGAIAHADHVAQMLAGHGMRVDIEGVVAHRIEGKTIAFTLAMGASFALSALIWPLLALAGVIATVGSTLADLDAGEGWLRAFISREVTENIIAWPADQKKTVDALRPTLLIVGPAEQDLIPTHEPSLTDLLPLGALLATAVVVATQPWIGSWPTVTAASVLAIGSVMVWASWWFQRQKAVSNPSRDVILRAFQQAERPTTLRVVWAMVGGGASHHDGLRTLLLNHRDGLSPACTRVLFLHPSTGVCSWIREEGRVRTTHADAILAELASLAKIPSRNDTTGARKAHQLGWRAAALCVSTDQIHIGTQVVCSIIAHADQLAKAKQW